MSEERWTLWRRGPLYAWQLNPSVKTWTEKDEPEEITVMRVSEHEAIMEDAHYRAEHMPGSREAAQIRN